MGYIVRNKPGGGITPELIINQFSNDCRWFQSWWYNPIINHQSSILRVVGFLVDPPNDCPDPDQCEDALVRILDDLYWCASPIPTLRFSNVAMENPPLMTFQTSIGDFPLPCFMTPEGISTLLGDQPFDRPQNLWLSLDQAWANGGTPLFLHDWINGVHEKTVSVLNSLLLLLITSAFLLIEFMCVDWISTCLLIKTTLLLSKS